MHLRKIENLRSRLAVSRKKAESLMALENTLIKQLLDQGDLEKAKTIMKKSLGTQEHIRSTDSYLEQVEDLLYNLNHSEIKRKVESALKIGNAACKVVENIMNIDNIEKITLLTKDGLKKQMEIDSAMKNINLGEQFEELLEMELSNENKKRLDQKKMQEINSRRRNVETVETLNSNE